MFYIEDFWKYEMDLETAVSIVKGQGNQVLIDGMAAIEEIVEENQDDSDDFWEVWFMEINAYNIVKTEMKELFA
tara:strand:- start:54 stop:275 length:222 start_codon:yes stop_codon:yes gene_type:complete